jgi:hypothetical protein
LGNAARAVASGIAGAATGRSDITPSPLTSPRNDRRPHHHDTPEPARQPLLRHESGDRVRQEWTGCSHSVNLYPLANESGNALPDLVPDPRRLVGTFR